MTQLDDLLQKAKDTVDIRLVYGDPVERGGATVIPVARVAGGGGGGAKGVVEGSGVGYGFRAEPVGVYVIREGKVQWVPAVNVNKIVAGALGVAVVSVLGLPRILKQARKLVKAT